MKTESHPFDYAKEYRQTGMQPLKGDKLTFEAGWDKEAREAGLIKMTDSKGKVSLFRAMDLISNLMILSGEKEARYMADGLFAKSKKKSIIEYNFFARASRMYMTGEMIRCTVQLSVPDELRQMKEVERKHIIQQDGMVSASPTAGQLPKSAPQLSDLQL